MALKVGRPPGSSPFTDTEKNVIAECIIEYTPLQLPQSRIIYIASKRLGRNIHISTFKRVQKSVQDANVDSQIWLDRFIQHDLVNLYRRRIEEAETTQKYLMQRFMIEVEKMEAGEKHDAYLISRLSSNIRDNGKLLAELGTCPPVLSRVFEAMSTNVADMNKLALKNTIIENDDDPGEHIESGIYLFNDPKPVATDPDVDPQRVF